MQARLTTESLTTAREPTEADPEACIWGLGNYFMSLLFDTLGISLNENVHIAGVDSSPQTHSFLSYSLTLLLSLSSHSADC